MKSRFAAACLLACLFSAGCDLPFLGGKDKDKEETGNPTSPTSPTTSLDAFAGTWSSISVSNPATGCGNLKYTITPTTATSANVTFTATCAGNIAVSGSGAGTLSGDAISWSANGLVSQGGVNCPFSFTNSKATMGADGQITVNYTGTVCGIPVSGTEVVKK
jgi:hypothetical protein